MSVRYEIEQRPEAALVVITLAGQIDRDAGAALSSAYSEAVGADPSTIVLDFTTVDYINSTGIALIVSLLGRARAEQRSVHAAGLSDHYRHVFDITRLSDFIEIHADVEAATHRSTS